MKFFVCVLGIAVVSLGTPVSAQSCQTHLATGVAIDELAADIAADVTFKLDACAEEVRIAIDGVGEKTYTKEKVDDLPSAFVTIGN